LTELDTKLVAAAHTYIAALATHRADNVPFARDCTRIEVGLKTGFSGDHLRRSLNRGLQYRVIESVTTPEFTMEDGKVRAKFDVITKPSLAGRRVCSHVDETFTFNADGEILHIRAKLKPFIRR
jgi:hypothetical protein